MIQKLQPFIGTWKTEGETRSGDIVSGTDTYEWFSGNFFLIHKVDVKMAGEQVTSMEVIGYDAATGKYPMHSYDNHGNTSVNQATENNGAWTFTGEKERGTFTFSKDGNVISGTWESSEDGKAWTPWMDIKLTKIS